jgi:hypothetical protein
MAEDFRVESIDAPATTGDVTLQLSATEGAKQI